MKFRHLLAVVSTGLASSLIGCAADVDRSEADTSTSDLTSLSARQRELRFEGKVIVTEDASDDQILEAVRAQTQTAFGALLNQEISVQSREVRDVDPASFKRRAVRAYDTDNAADPGTAMLEVRYKYVDNAVVALKWARHTSLPSALLAPNYNTAANKARVLTACTRNDQDARDDARTGILWYDFNPGHAKCRDAVNAEQRIVDGDREKLSDPRTQVSKSEVDRLFLPVTFALTSKSTNEGASYPEYDRLFKGGVKQDRMVLSLVFGRLDHAARPGHANEADITRDSGYFEWMDMLGVLLEAQPTLKLKNVEPAETLDTVQVGGRTFSGLSFKDFVQWTVYDNGYPAGLSRAEKTALRSAIGKKLDRHWVTFEKNVSVAINGGAPKSFVIELRTYVGADDTDATPHKRALKSSDVVLYSGHSYIGRGPLDPNNFRPGDLPASYQLVFFDSCVSYNYYEEGFFALKEGGTRNLDLIVNGIEAPQAQSGATEGAFIASLLSGKHPSFKTLLETVRPTDSLRVVDGELDNAYAPARSTVHVVDR